MILPIHRVSTSLLICGESVMVNTGVLVECQSEGSAPVFPSSEVRFVRPLGKVIIIMSLALDNLFVLLLLWGENFGLVLGVALLVAGESWLLNGSVLHVGVLSNVAHLEGGIGLYTEAERSDGMNEEKCRSTEIQANHGRHVGTVRMEESEDDCEDDWKYKRQRCLLYTCCSSMRSMRHHGNGRT